jgi:hypothetical protein
MGLGASLILIAVGAILWWAVDVDTKGVDLPMVGTILFVIGAVGLLLSLLFWSTWGGFGGRRSAPPPEVPPENGVTYEETVRRERHPAGRL